MSIKKKIIMVAALLTGFVILILCRYLYGRNMNNFTPFYLSGMIDYDVPDYDNLRKNIPLTPFIEVEYSGNVGYYTTFGESEIFYIAQRINGGFSIYCYDTKSRNTKLIYTICDDILYSFKGMSVNKDYILVVCDEQIIRINRRTASSKKLLSYSRDVKMCIDGNYIVYQYGNSFTQYNLMTGFKKEIIGISADSFYVDNGIMYYSDIDNGYKLSSYNLHNGYINKYDTDCVIRFEHKDGRFYAVLQNKELYPIG